MKKKSSSGFEPGIEKDIHILFLVFNETSMQKLREKGLKLSGYMIELLKNKFGRALEIITPEEESSRGCQVSFIIEGSEKVELI